MATPPAVAVSIASPIRRGVRGKSRGRIPSGARVSRTALARAVGVAIEPASPMPFAPKGLHDGQHPGTLRGGADIHAAHLGMRSRGADDREIRHLRQDNIVNVTRLSTQKTWGLAPPHHPR